MRCAAVVKPHFFRHALGAFACSLALAGVSSADLPSPRLDRIQPMGAGAGETVDVEVAGADDSGAERLWFDHPGITSQFTAEHKFKVSVAADVPQGTYDVRLVGRFGVSSPRLFQVTRQTCRTGRERAEQHARAGPGSGHWQRAQRHERFQRSRRLSHCRQGRPTRHAGLCRRAAGLANRRGHDADHRRRPIAGQQQRLFRPRSADRFPISRRWSVPAERQRSVVSRRLFVSADRQRAAPDRKYRAAGRLRPASRPI